MTHDPTHGPTHDPTYDPTYDPTGDPTYDPTYEPSPVINANMTCDDCLSAIWWINGSVEEQQKGLLYKDSDPSYDTYQEGLIQPSPQYKVSGKII